MSELLLPFHLRRQQVAPALFRRSLRHTLHHLPPMLDPLNFSEQQIWILINRSALEKVISNHAYEMFQRGNFVVRAVSLVSAPGKVSSPHAIPHGTTAMPKRIFIYFTY